MNLHVLHDCEQFHLFYDQYGPLKVLHLFWRVKPCKSGLKKLHSILNDYQTEHRVPLFTVWCHDGQHDKQLWRFFEWFGFREADTGYYHGVPCTYLVRI